MNYYVFKPSQALWIMHGVFHTYNDAVMHCQKFGKAGSELVILKSTYKENGYGAPMNYPGMTEGEIDAD